MRGRTYRFLANGISGSGGGGEPGGEPGGEAVIHLEYIYGSFVNDDGGSNTGITGSGSYIDITIPNNHSTTVGSLYYQCANHGGMSKNLLLFHKV